MLLNLCKIFNNFIKITLYNPLKLTLMNKKIITICEMIFKLPKALQIDFCELNLFQIQKILSLRKSSPQSSDEMLNTNLKISNAQKYRYLKRLISLKFISKKHNQYFINKS